MPKLIVEKTEITYKEDRAKQCIKITESVIVDTSNKCSIFIYFLWQQKEDNKMNLIKQIVNKKLNHISTKELLKYADF